MVSLNRKLHSNLKSIFGEDLTADFGDFCADFKDFSFNLCQSAKSVICFLLKYFFTNPCHLHCCERLTLSIVSYGKFGDL